MDNVQQALRQKPSIRPGNVILRKKTSKAQRGSTVSTFVPSIASTAKNMMNGDVGFALGPQIKVVTFVGQSNVPTTMSDTQSNTRNVF